MTPEARAARERKQKIFVVIGGLFLVGMLAIQLPKLLGGSSSSQAATTTTDESTLPAPDGVQDGSAAPPRSVQAAEVAKLTLFSSFSAKDPFVQQVVTRPPAAAGQSGAAEKAKDAATEKPTEFATGPAVTAAATIVTVNGVRQVLEPGARFPASDPLFVLVAEKPGSKAVVIAIAGGAYASGVEKMPLRMGKPLTLVNTTTGAKYKIALLSVGSGDAPDSGGPKP